SKGSRPCARPWRGERVPGRFRASSPVRQCREPPDDWRSRPRSDARPPRRLRQGGEAMATSRVPDDLDVVRGGLYATLLSLALWSLVLALFSFLTSGEGSL